MVSETTVQPEPPTMRTPGRNALLTLSEAAVARDMVKSPPDNASRAGRRLLRLLQEAEDSDRHCLMRTASGMFRTTLAAVESAIGIVGQECTRDRRVDEVAERTARSEGEQHAAIRGVIESGRAIVKLGEMAANHEHRITRLEGAVFGRTWRRAEPLAHRPRQYSPAKREAAVALVAAGTPIRAVARQLCVGVETVRRWRERALSHGTADCSQEREYPGEESHGAAAVA